MPNHHILSIILPCFNERENIKVFIPPVIQVLSDLNLEIIFVDDGSTDGTIDEIKSLQLEMPTIRLIERGKLMGLGSALRDGYDSAKGDFILSFDCDSPIPIENIKKVVDTLLTGRYDLVLGSRYLKGSFYETPNDHIKKKKMLSSFANSFFRIATLIPVTDFSFNCRGLKNEAWKKIKPQSSNNFFLFEMIWRASMKGLSIKEIPVKFFDRKAGESKLKFRSEMIKYILQFFKLQGKYLFRKVD